MLLLFSKKLSVSPPSPPSNFHTLDQCFSLYPRFACYYEYRISSLKILYCAKCSTFSGKDDLDKSSSPSSSAIDHKCPNGQTTSSWQLHRDFYETPPARVLKGHVIMSEETNSFEGCVDRCFRNSKCYSINYYTRKERCELNDKTTFMNPEDLVRELDGTYLDILRPYSDCSDLFCDRDQICKMKGVDRFQCKGWRRHFIELWKDWRFFEIKLISQEHAHVHIQIHLDIHIHKHESSITYTETFSVEVLVLCSISFVETCESRFQHAVRMKNYMTSSYTGHGFT